MPPLDLDDLIPDAEEELLPCGVCRRKFSRSCLIRHTPICQKFSARKFRVYDSRRRRTEGIPTVNPTEAEPGASWTGSDWRRTHEKVIATIRADKALRPLTRAPNRGPDYTQCHMYCSTQGTDLCQECASRDPVDWAR